MAQHPTTAQLEAGLDEIRRSPRDEGTVDWIVRRPAENEREVLEEATLDVDQGLVGDMWSVRPSRDTADGSPHPGRQLNVMNARAIALFAHDRERWSLAGDQMYLDLDLGEKNVPAGTRLAVGTAVIEVTKEPHEGCKKFRRRFGLDAIRFVNSPVGKELHLRGVCARVIASGTVRRGDVVRKLS